MNFWDKKKVFITGHTGFKGSWLSLCLQYFNAEICGFALTPPTTPNLFTLAHIAKNSRSIIGDICDFAHLQKSIQDFEPDIVFHLAAQPLVRHSYHNPIETYLTNVMGTVHVLEASRHVPTIKAIVNVTTDKCYENKEWQWGYREIDRLGGHDPYSNSKACSELVTASYRDSFFQQQQVGVATARAGNVIGGGDWAQDRLIPDIIRASIAQESVRIRNPHAVRPWQHVLEPLHGYLLLAQGLYQAGAKYAESFNFGPDDNDVKPVHFIADYITARFHNRWVLDDASHLHEAAYLKLDCAKAKTFLKWTPAWDLEKALRETIDWYLAYQTGTDMLDFTRQQIQKFMTLKINKQREDRDVDERIYACSVR